MPSIGTVALVQQLVDAILDACVAQEGRNELLPEPSGSSPPEKPPGRITICALRMEFSSCSSALAEGIRGEVADYDDLSCAACILNRTGGVVLAVGAGEYRNNRQRLCVLDRRSGNIALGEGNLGQMLVGSSRLVGNTLSSLPSKAFVSSSMVTDLSATVIFSSSVV